MNWFLELIFDDGTKSTTTPIVIGYTSKKAILQALVVEAAYWKSLFFARDCDGQRVVPRNWRIVGGKVTEYDINERIAKIDELANAGDFEAAAGAEDDLRLDLIKWLAGVGDAKVRPSANRVAKLAQLVLSTEQIQFKRMRA